jgi:hypothetical protein
MYLSIATTPVVSTISGLCPEPDSKAGLVADQSGWQNLVEQLAKVAPRVIHNGDDSDVDKADRSLLLLDHVSALSDAR